MIKKTLCVWSEFIALFFCLGFLTIIYSLVLSLNYVFNYSELTPNGITNKYAFCIN